jgi:hypothetical protein
MHKSCQLASGLYLIVVSQSEIAKMSFERPGIPSAKSSSMKTNLIQRVVLAVAAICTASPAFATLIVNGDFEAGNTGFSSAYTYVTPTAGTLVPPAVYTVGTNPRDSHGSFYSMGDHTTGSGQFMIINGSTTTGIPVWEGSASFALTVGTQYDFSAWVASVHPTSPAVLTFMVGSTTLGTLSPDSDGSWKRLFATFTATETSPVFKLLNSNPAFGGNDFAIDDLDLFVPGTTNNPGRVPDAGAGVLGLVTLVGLCAAGLRRKSNA